MSIGGVPGATLDLRGRLGEAGMKSGELITFKKITLLGDSSESNVFGSIASLSWNQQWVHLDGVVVRDLHCREAGGYHLSMQHFQDVDVNLDMCQVSMGVFRIKNATINTSRQWTMSVTNSVWECKDYQQRGEDRVQTRVCPPLMANGSVSIQGIHVWLVGLLCFATLVAIGCVVSYVALRRRKNFPKISAKYHIDKEVNLFHTKGFS